MNPTSFYPMLITSFSALYANSKKCGLSAFSTLPYAREKVRPAIFIASRAQHSYFAPVTSRQNSLHREHIKIDLKYVPALERQSYLDAKELWRFPSLIIPHFAKCISYSVDKTYVDSVIFPVYLLLIKSLNTD